METQRDKCEFVVLGGQPGGDDMGDLDDEEDDDEDDPENLEDSDGNRE